MKLGPLTKQQTRVLLLLCAGKTVGEIADELDISLKTVGSHRYSVLSKLGVHNNVELLLYAQKQGWVPCEDCSHLADHDGSRVRSRHHHGSSTDAHRGVVVRGPGGRMSQEALDFGLLYRVEDSARSLYRMLNDAIKPGEMLRVAGACGIDRGDLRRSLDRDGRRVAVEHALAIAALASTTDRRTIASTFAGALGFDIRETTPLTDKERADRLEVAMRSMPLGEQLVANALGGRR